MMESNPEDNESKEPENLEDNSPQGSRSRYWSGTLATIILIAVGQPIAAFIVTLPLVYFGIKYQQRVSTAVLRGALGFAIGDQLLTFPIALLLSVVSIGLPSPMIVVVRTFIGIICAALIGWDQMRKPSGRRLAIIAGLIFVISTTSAFMLPIILGIMKK